MAKGMRVRRLRRFPWIFTAALLLSGGGLASGLALAAALSSCGGLVLQFPSDASADASDAGPDSSFFNPPPPVASGPCGASGSGACSREGLVCEFGDDPSSACNKLKICTNGQLQVLTVADSLCPTVNAGVAAACPGYQVNPSVPEGGTVCAAGTTCDYPQGRCQCTATAPSFQPTWHCVDPGAACTATRPRLGQPCTQLDQVCGYEACGVSPSFGVETCDAGEWVAAPPILCP